MSLNGIRTPVNTIRLPRNPVGGRVERDGAASIPAPQTAPQQPQTEAVRAQVQAAAAQETVTVEPPEGTDPELWSVLTAEERKFFAKAGAMGPLTYGYLQRSGQEHLPVNRGGRLDVRA